MNKPKRNLGIIWDESLMKQCDRLPAVQGRASLVHELLIAYDLFKTCKIIRSTPAIAEDLTLFHSDLYINHLRTFLEVEDDYIPTPQDELYGIGYDCSPVSDMYDLVSTVAGSSITAAKCLILGLCDVVINWCGGWHHANRHAAEGFCYVNDIVIAIEMLLRKFPKVLYIDLDVHHGNGVQDAYNVSKSVFTLSFHKYEPGFYPGSGGIEEIGMLDGTGYTCNFPLHAAYSDESFKYSFEKTFTTVYEHFLPDAIVVQCGADSLANDPHGGGGLTINGYCSCIQQILDKQKPIMFLGGGGYNFANAAKLWASITALIAGVKLDENIPEHVNWPSFGPDYVITVQPLLGKDLNTKEYLDQCISIIAGNIRTYLSEVDKDPQFKEKDNQSKKWSTNSYKNNKCYTSYNKPENSEKCNKNKADIYEFSD